MSMRNLIAANQRPDTTAAVAERVRVREAAKCGVVDREIKYPTLTGENAREAIAYQEERIAFHLRLASFRDHYGLTDAEMVRAVQAGQWSIDPPIAEWLVLIGRGDLLRTPPALVAEK